MKKLCPRCDKRKDIDDFAWRNKGKGKRQSWCRGCHKEVNSTLYYDGDRRDQIRALNAVYLERNQQHVAQYKMKRGCEICGYNKCAAALDLHHVKGEKEGNISRMVRCKVALSRIIAEIEKCDVLCVRCHRELHAAP